MEPTELSVKEAAQMLNISYFQFLAYVRRDKAQVLSLGLVRKVGWGWIISSQAIVALREAGVGE